MDQSENELFELGVATHGNDLLQIQSLVLIFLFSQKYEYPLTYDTSHIFRSKQNVWEQSCIDISR